MRWVILLASTFAIVAGLGGGASADTVVGSEHDFSVSIPQPGVNNPYAGNYVVNPSGMGLPIDQPCVFCHTPHGASTDVKYQNAGGNNMFLWNRRVPRGGNNATSFKLYSSASLTMITLQNPTGLSLMCLSCHDGVTSIAVGNPVTPTLLNTPGSGNEEIIRFNPALEHQIGAVRGPLVDYLNIGNLDATDTTSPIDLSDDHPVAFTWVNGVPGITDPDAQGNFGATGMKLWGGRMECSTCHNVHDRAIRPFLRMDNFGSAMCITCHQK